MPMIELRETSVFPDWLGGLKDGVAKARIAARVRRLAFGNPGDGRPVGQGTSELRIHHGSGYRVFYFVQRGTALIVLLCGGGKRTQSRDIEIAKSLAKDLE